PSFLRYVCPSASSPRQTNVPFTTPHGVATHVPAWARLPVAAHQRAAGPSARRPTGGSGERYRPPRPVRGTVGRPNERGETATNRLVRSQDPGAKTMAPPPESPAMSRESTRALHHRPQSSSSSSFGFVRPAEQGPGLVPRLGGNG